MTNRDNLFFIIDSEKLGEVKTGLYGFMLDEKLGIVEQRSLPDGELKCNGTGNYVYVRAADGKITVEQDCNGSFGLFLYEKDGRFALSNSFFYLYEYLQGREMMTLNREYAQYLLIADLCSIAYMQTPVREITRLDKDSRVTIDVSAKALSQERLEWGEQSLSPDSPEGIAALDKWMNRWASIFAGIKKSTNNISCDLSGGFDSRLTFMLLHLSGIDLNEIFINSINDNLHTHTEDYEIAQQIAGAYNATLNNRRNMVFGLAKYDFRQTVYNSALLKFGFHKQMFWKTSCRTQLTYTITGSGGESLRSYWDYSPEEYTKRQINRASRFSPMYRRDFEKAVSDILEKNFDSLGRKYGVAPDDFSLSQKLYNNVRSCLHFGGGSAENYISNVVTLSPLLDPLIQTLKLHTDECPDNNLLTALIYTRACPELLGFRFEGGRSIKVETVEYAERINAKYVPFRLEISDFTPPEGAEISSGNAEGTTAAAVDAFVKKCFSSNRFKAAFSGIFGPEVYNDVIADAGKRTFHPLSNMYAGLPLAYVADTCASRSAISLYDYMDQCAQDASYANYAEPDFGAMLKKHNTARIDIKNFGDGNDITFEKITDGAENITSPAWFSKTNGKGYVYTSYSGSATIVLTCRGAGTLRIALRSVDTRDSNGNRLPAWIDYTRMTVNGTEMFDDIKRVWHDEPFSYSRLVADGEKLTLELEWEQDLVKNSMPATMSKLELAEAMRVEQQTILDSAKKIESLTKELAKLRESHADELTKLRESHTSELAGLRESYNAEATGLREETSSLRLRLAEGEKTIADMRVKAAHSEAQIQRLQELNRDKKENVARLGKRIEELDGELTAVRASSSYRLGNMLVKPFGVLKRKKS